MMIRRSVVGLAVLSLILFCSVALQAQDVASITGVVTDQTGAVLPGVDVTLENPQTGVKYAATTNSDGSYTISQVKPGPGYKIEFNHDGFSGTVFFGVYMNVDTTRTQNAKLALGRASETVEVSAASENVTLDTTSATVGNNFQVQFLNDLPIQNRSNPAALFVDQPGVTLDGAVTGARVDQSRVTVDGLDVNDMATGFFGTIIGSAPVDSVQEFRGVTAGELSSANGGGGGEFELVTKSGTNTFHGALVEYHRDTALEANDWFNNNAGVPRPPLIRNQFGGNVGGPILKDKLFFFFDYNARRDTLSNLVNRTVPLDSFRDKTISYLNGNGEVSTLDEAGVKALDPQGVGFNQDLIDLFNSRYPHSNNSDAGDLLNTGGFRFNAPFPYKESDYVTRVDYNLNSKMKLYGKFNTNRITGTESSIWFPGDPATAPFIDKSYTWVVGHIWTIGTTKINQASYGEVYEDLNFPNTFNPTGATQFGAFGGDGAGGSILSGPYRSAINAQGRTYPVPVIRDDFSWQKGKHSFQFGGTFKWPKPSGYTILNYDSPTIGLGGFTSGLDPDFRPTDICQPSDSNCDSSTANGLYDPAFALALAPYTAVSSTFNYNAQGSVLPQGSGQTRTYRYYETELYFGDTWRMTPKLTVSYGLRWINYSVPYEIHGIQSEQNIAFDPYFSARVAQSAASASGDSSVPLISYGLGGKANHGPGYYKPQYKDFGPRIAAAYAFNPKTVINGGIGIVYDQTVINAVQYQQSQFDYLFQTSATQPIGFPNDPGDTLFNNPRFTGVDSPPAPPAAPTITKPFFPFVDSNGTPTGLGNGQAFNETIDPKLKTPYSIQLNFGIQHEIPGGFILKMSYAGRMGRRLLAQADANQLIDFRDPTPGSTGQLMSNAFANIETELRAGADPLGVPDEPWFQNVLPAGVGQAFGVGNNTQILTFFLNSLINRGDFADSIQALAGAGLLPPNVGMGSQFSENTFYTNKGSSSYNGLLTTLHKNAGHGLQFDLNYTWAHSIDNVSLIANSAAFAGQGFVCDVLRPRECRGSSDFDVTHYFNGDFIYDLPFGRGKAFGGAAPRWLDEAIGGWSVSGLPNWHSGNAYYAQTLAFVAGYANNAPAILTGSPSDLKIHLNGGKGQPLYGYANPNQANAAYTGPVGFDIGARNNLRGPSYFNIDLGLAKSFPIYGDRVALKFRADAFNALNHPNFQTPCADLTSLTCLYGAITSTVGTGLNNLGPSARVLQLALRLEF